MNRERIEMIDQLARRHAASLILYARQWSNQPEDDVQEALLDLMRSDPWPDRPEAWLFGATRHRALNRLRSRRRRERHEEAAASSAANWFVADPTARLQAEEVGLLLERLELPLREAVILRMWGNLTYAEIGRLTQASASTACRRFEEAIDLLRQWSGSAEPTMDERPTGTALDRSVREYLTTRPEHPDQNDARKP
ncbi:MAG: sigma-70 family RNA polymerase sigma factor [Planctomycetales bacterium]|nr:sigma-70 family RNA polymerase sigma factor [Planctomycetales bacterium]